MTKIKTPLVTPKLTSGAFDNIPLACN